MKLSFKKIILILTIAYIALWMCAIDSILDNHLFLESVEIMIGLVVFNILIFTHEEWDKIMDDPDIE